MTARPDLLLSSQVEQSIINLICFYEAFGIKHARDVKESWIQLLTWLDIFDYRGRPLCRYWAEHDWVAGKGRCCHYLTTDNESLSNAFRKFYIDASDPLIERQDDDALFNATVTFATTLCCVEHKGSKKRLETLAGELLPIIKKWRKRYVFCEPLTPACLEEVLEDDPPGRISGIFNRRKKNSLRKKHQKSRSVSPSSDEEAFPVSPVPERPLRPVSSAYDILMTPRRSASKASDWNVQERGRSRKAHLASIGVKTQAFWKSSGLGKKRLTGRPLSTIQVGGSRDSMEHRFTTSSRID